MTVMHNMIKAYLSVGSHICKMFQFSTNICTTATQSK